MTIMGTRNNVSNTLAWWVLSKYLVSRDGRPSVPMAALAPPRYP
jgi:hypothetical protein